MNVFVNELKNRFDVELTYEIDGVYYLWNEKLVLSFIEPHSGTDFKYVLRADFPETFDRWSNTLFEEFFDEKDFEKNLLKMEKFVESKDRILKEEMITG